MNIIFFIISKQFLSAAMRFNSAIVFFMQGISSSSKTSIMYSSSSISCLTSDKYSCIFFCHYRDSCHNKSHSPYCASAIYYTFVSFLSKMQKYKTITAPCCKKYSVFQRPALPYFTVKMFYIMLF